MCKLSQWNLPVNGGFSETVKVFKKGMQIKTAYYTVLFNIIYAKIIYSYFLVWLFDIKPLWQLAPFSPITDFNSNKNNA